MKFNCFISNYCSSCSRKVWLLSDIDKNTITTDQLNDLVTDLGHVLFDTAQKLQGKVKIKNVAPNCHPKPWYDKLCKENEISLIWQDSHIIE